MTSRSCSLLAALLLALAPAASAHAGDSWSTPHPGVARLHRTSSTQNINALVVDLCHAGVSLRATKHGERGRTPSSFGSLTGAHAVVNGDFFASGYSTDGLAVGDGAVWPGSGDHGYVTPLAIGDHRIELPHHNNITAHAAWMRQVVSGHPTLLDDGNHVGNPGDPLCINRHPRTAVGISEDHSKLIVVVVDGRAPGRAGMTCKELSALLKGLGAFDAVNLDGGGSSAMWIRNVGVVNNPSDGSQRVVGNHLAVFARGSGAATHCPCKRQCKGSKIIDEHCGEGDCAVFGANCADDQLGVRCVSVFCPALGQRKTCLPDGRIADCDNGGLKNGKACAAGKTCQLTATSAACAAPPAPPDSGPPVIADASANDLLVDARVAELSTPDAGTRDAAADDARVTPHGTDSMGGELGGGCNVGGEGALPTALLLLALGVTLRFASARN
ncbi:MAG: phosphodiester glycosidase family protein [Myxococcales bacterium]|nr:phosphodiester glycosidase family protein [Myxococcales bacterium]